MNLNKVALVLASLIVGVVSLSSHADDNAYFKAGPLELNIPLKTGQVTYMFNFKRNENLVGGETPFITLWNRVEGTFGAVTSLQGQGTPFVGGNILIGNILEKFVTFPPELKIGGYSGWNFNSEEAIYGLKCSYKLWS